VHLDLFKGERARRKKLEGERERRRGRERGHHFGIGDVLRVRPLPSSLSGLVGMLWGWQCL